GQLLAYQGKLDQALEEWQTAYQIASAHFPAEVPTIEEVLGAGYLQLASMENAVFSAHAGRCLFPMRPDLQYRKTSNAERAAQHFLRYLEQKPDDLEVKWLLNIACMNTGRYPSGVPKQHLIAPTVLESK